MRLQGALRRGDHGIDVEGAVAVTLRVDGAHVLLARHEAPAVENLDLGIGVEQVPRIVIGGKQMPRELLELGDIGAHEARVDATVLAIALQIGRLSDNRDAIAPDGVEVIERMGARQTGPHLLEQVIARTSRPWLSTSRAKSARAFLRHLPSLRNRSPIVTSKPPKRRTYISSTLEPSVTFDTGAAPCAEASRRFQGIAMVS